MRMMLLEVVVVLLLAGSSEARPQAIDAIARPELAETGLGGGRPSTRSSNVSYEVRDDSSVQATANQRHLKDLQYIDQSLRTVATQLLNVSGPEDNKNIVNKPLMVQNPADKSDAISTKAVNAETSNVESVGIGFGRPINSKFGYFESSHPGQAMALTEEELEKELSSTRLITAHKNHPTTTGGISTWILLNPPSTTIKTSEESTKNTKSTTEATVTTNEKPTTMLERVATTEKVIEKVTVPISTTVQEKVSTSKKPVVTTTRRTTVSPKTTTAKVERTESTSVKVPLTTTPSTLESRETASSTISTTKKTATSRTTTKPKVTISKTTAVTKTSTKTGRPSSSSRPNKPNNRRTTLKPDLVRNENASTAKIEKVTFKPIPVITTQKSKADATEKPMFVTKIKASVLMDTQKATTTPVPSTSISTTTSTTSKSTLSDTDLIEVPVRSKPIGTKTNNVLKVQLKKPIDDVTKIEIEPIKVNAPILTIEKLGTDDNKSEEALDKETDMLPSSKIDLKFDFNPELTKINVDSSTESSSTSTTTSTTTKRPRHTKRKKNKVRRRKPTTSTTATIASSTSSLDLIDNEIITELATVDGGIQESKVAPDTKVSTNTTKTKKKPAQKPISTQIYNFLSREVMPSFGMMSLVGLGLGLASYFFYPFSGTIARRNYEVEPKYKYNFDEYGGSYGQSEEEVLSKVLQGMTTNENKYPGMKGDDYYRYQHYDGVYDPHTTRKTDQRYPVSSSPVYRPENTPSVVKYKNTDYRYYDTSTPNYYDRSKHPEYVVAQDISGSRNRQFVVGNVPKEHPVYDQNSQVLSTTGKIANSNYNPTESGQTQFERDIAQNFNFPTASVNVQSYGPQETQTLRTDDGYEEIEITPTAVAVEHGPRNLRKKRSFRLKRDSVIQIIPTKRELEEEEKEENLSNEILDIIDSAIPVGEPDNPKKRHEDNEVEDLASQEKKKQEEERTRLKQSTTKISTTEVTEKTTNSHTPVETSTETRDGIESSSDSSSTTVSTSSTSMETDNSTTSRSTEESTVDWSDLTTKHTPKPEEENHFNLFSFVKKVAEIKFRLGLTLLKHASEGFARYLGHVQKRFNGEE